MKKFIFKIKNKVANLAIRTQMAIVNPTGEGFVDSGVKILIAIVIGALLLGGLYALFGDTIIPTLKAKITALFNYTA